MLSGILTCKINGIEGRCVLDGHTRLREAKKLGITPKYETDEVLSFDSVDDAICWVIEHQAARRNLSDEQQTIIWGRYYELRKKPHGDANRISNSSGKNYHMETTAQQVAKEFGVTEKTVRNAATKTKKIESLGLTNAVTDGTIRKISTPALNEIASRVEAQPRAKKKIVQQVIEQAKANAGVVKVVKPKAPAPQGPDKPDTDVELLLETLLTRITNNIWMAREDWDPYYVNEFRKRIESAFTCSIPDGWRD